MLVPHGIMFAYVMHPLSLVLITLVKLGVASCSDEECESSVSLLQSHLQMEGDGDTDELPMTRTYFPVNYTFGENALQQNLQYGNIETPLDFEVFALEASTAQIPNFNPAMAKLTPYVADALDMPNAAYIVVARHYADLCERYVIPSQKGTHTPSRSTTVMLLDENLHTLAEAKIMKPPGFHIDNACNSSWESTPSCFGNCTMMNCTQDYFVGHDVRLLVKDDMLLMSFVSYDETLDYFGETWVTELVLWNADGKLAASAEDYTLATPKLVDAGKNIGLFENTDGLHALLWSFPPQVRNFSMSGQIVGEQDYDGPEILEAYEKPHRQMSNSINPVLLPEDGLFLGIGHDHGGTIIGGYTGYEHRFVLFETEAPFKASYLSRPFCFPSPDRPDKCENIQFLTQAVLTSGMEGMGKDLLLSVGILDCEARIYRIPLAAVLAFTKAYNASAEYLQEKITAENQTIVTESQTIVSSVEDYLNDG